MCCHTRCKLHFFILGRRAVPGDGMPDVSDFNFKYPILKTLCAGTQYWRRRCQTAATRALRGCIW